MKCKYCGNETKKQPNYNPWTKVNSEIEVCVECKGIQ